MGGSYDEELCFGEGFGMISSYFNRPVRRTVMARTEMELYVLSKDDSSRPSPPTPASRTGSALRSWLIRRRCNALRCGRFVRRSTCSPGEIHP